MLKCNVCRPFCCLRIVVPGNEIHVFSPLLIIQTVIKAHQIGRNLRIRNPFLNRRILRPEILQHAVRHEPLVIQRNAGEHASSFFKMFAQKIRRHNLFPFIEGMSPEMRVPCLIHSVQRAIFLPKPYTERILTVLTIAGSAKLIADMPGHNVLLILIML